MPIISNPSFTGLLFQKKVKMYQKYEQNLQYEKSFQFLNEKLHKYISFSKKFK